MRTAFAAALIAAIALGSAATAQDDAETFRFAYQGELKVLDQYTLNETFSLGILANVYEGLTRRDAELNLLPGLAERWEVVDPTTWRFYLRKGVRFHNGNPFTAQDVVFSAARVRSAASDLKTRIPPEAEFVAIDDHTVEVRLAVPNPILPAEWDIWGIMDKEWSEANGAVAVTSVADAGLNYAALHANGTGPFKVVRHQVGVETVFAANEDWWNWPQRKFTVERVVFKPLPEDATRVAALLSGELDLVYPVPVQDLPRVEANAGTDVLTGPELRTIFLGFDQTRDRLLHGEAAGGNPFNDRRVRKAVYQAIDVELIRDKIMRGLSAPTAVLVAPAVFPGADAIERHPYDLEAARRLLREAGYGDGFSVVLDCPNDRYVNDSQICQAVAAMLARLGIEVAVNAQPKSQYFAKVLAGGGYDTSFYLLGWTPSGLDSYGVLKNLVTCRNADGTEGGAFNLGGYCNEKVDALTRQILAAVDPAVRDELIAEVFAILHEDVAYVPLHQQRLAWGKAINVDLQQRPDNILMFDHVKKR